MLCASERLVNRYMSAVAEVGEMIIFVQPGDIVIVFWLLGTYIVG